MADKKTNATKRVEAMLTYFHQLRNKKENGVNVHSYDYCVMKAAEKFFYAKGTVEAYVSIHAKKPSDGL
jgi:hypothetical protein